MTPVQYYSYVAIEGNIGAGKTSLATMLAKDMHADLMLETFAENLFLEKFYNSSEKYAFPLETAFLIERQQQIKNYFTRRTLTNTVSDYIFDKCLVFAKVNLKANELAFFIEMYTALARQMPRPDIILYLDNKAANLKRNILQRGRVYERGIEESYLQKIEASYREYFLTIQDIPVLWVDVCEEDFIKDYTNYEKLKNLFNESFTKKLHYITL